MGPTGELKEAEAELRHAKELSPTLFLIDRDIANVLILQQRFHEALALVQQMPTGTMRDQGLALAHYAAGNVLAADAALADLTAYADGPNADPSSKIGVAEVHAFRGDKEQALKEIEQILGPGSSAQTHAGLWVKTEILVSPFFGSLKDHARWRPLLASAH